MSLRKLPLLAVLIALVASTGCVQRRFTVRSNPPGATVFVDNTEIGTTPVSTDFIYYGTREIRLVKEGYETLTLNQPITVPWYQYFPLDFVTENLVPGEIRDQRDFTYNMIPTVQQPTEQLLGRAENLRQNTHAQPAAAVMPAPVYAAPSGPGPVYSPAPTPIFGTTPPVYAAPPPGYAAPPVYNVPPPAPAQPLQPSTLEPHTLPPPN